MSAEAVAAVMPISATLASLAPVAPAGENVAAPGFANMVAEQLSSVNSQLLRADTDAQQLAAGQVQNLHEVMIRMEQAKLSFQLLVQVRNHVLEAYQDVMKTQV